MDWHVRGVILCQSAEYYDILKYFLASAECLRLFNLSNKKRT